ncbi:VIT1/CCC1 transporter family protein [Proteiniphilum sp.]|uniref:VIT1/CCC1 transporter family protein n=1 Tax=Proteiniphilum sp. TaxID=1926877 RepID=UPI002B1F155D|nr:VIT1/CCC1 transporter family protein [Proteiniphilum sp.]MEA4916589.1 VIT1/CCC1 transporter family protein [Proteiniphilum sp.]
MVKAQRAELTESKIYYRVADFEKNENNKAILLQIAKNEEHQSATWKSYTQQEVLPYHWKVPFYTLLIRFFGLTFGIKLLERDAHKGVQTYGAMRSDFPEGEKMYETEKENEDKLIELLNDKPLDYLGSIVLGLNDALVELTGVLAGLTLGIQSSPMIAAIGIITGISAAFSMAGSEYLSTKTENTGKVKPLTSAIYTGIAYIATVIALILPYLIVKNVFIALLITVAIAVTIIYIFNFYVSVAKGTPFRKRFLEMVSISLGVATVSFFIGLIVNRIFNINV